MDIDCMESGFCKFLSIGNPWELSPSVLYLSTCDYRALEMCLTRTDVCNECKLPDFEQYFRNVKFLIKIFYIDYMLKYFRYSGLKYILKSVSPFLLLFNEATGKHLNSIRGSHFISPAQHWSRSLIRKVWPLTNNVSIA